jgi:hypothetical protein
MAWLEEHPTSGHFKICFRWCGKKLKKTIKTTARSTAETALARFEENLHLLERGRLELPPGADLCTFLISDGKLNGKPVPTMPTFIRTLGQLRDSYVEIQSNGAMEQNSLDTIYIEAKRILSLVGCGNNVEAFCRDTLAPLVTPATKVYSQLREDIFGR